MADTYVVIDDYNEEVKSCVGVYDNYCMALGRAYQLACDMATDPNLNEEGKYNISIPKWDSMGDDFMYLEVEIKSNYHYIYIYYYGDKKTGKWEVA